MGSPDLKPETSESWELGLYYMGEEGWLEGVESSVTVFRNDVKDRISISRTSDVNAAPGYQNFVGFETGANGAYRYLATTTLTKLVFRAWKPN